MHRDSHSSGGNKAMRNPLYNSDDRHMAKAMHESLSYITGQSSCLRLLSEDSKTRDNALADDRYLQAAFLKR
jgi:hypothetical protein